MRDQSLSIFVDRCGSAVESLYAAILNTTPDIDTQHAYSESVRHVVRILAVLLATEQMAENRALRTPIMEAARCLHMAASNFGDDFCTSYMQSCKAAAHYGIFTLGDDALLSDHVLTCAAKSILQPQPDTPIDSIFFQTMPLWWIGCAYQRLLTYRPAADGASLESNSFRRKKAGVYYTPPALVSYIVESVISSLLDTGSDLTREQNSHPVRVLDPAMGGGDFLTNAISYLRSIGYGELSGIAAECVYGVDIDPVSTEISRFCVWASSGFADRIYADINSHLVCGNALGTGDGMNALADNKGFDAVIGNPPYIAAKNGLAHASTRGQSDSYLLFLESVMKERLVKPGGMLSMVLPDPMLVRENAAEIRRRLVSDWTILSLLHISGAFSDASVANIVPICRNAKLSSTHINVARVERIADRRNFLRRPRYTALALSRRIRTEVITSQPRYELLYMLDEGPFGDIIRRIHGDKAALGEYREPFVPLRSLNVKATYRGEEAGKSTVSRERGDIPVILGGQSIRPYEVLWEGIKTSRNWIKKPIERYHSTKIILQKSSARLVAALDSVTRDHPGFVFPQSVYGIELRKPGIDEIYLLCILNSELMNEYIRRTVTGYKFVQPQLELEDIRALPIYRVDFATPTEQRKKETTVGIEIFERQLERGSSFAELSNYVSGKLAHSDVVHDVLVYIGRRVIDLTRAARTAPTPNATRELEAARTAVEVVVNRLYSCNPSQMDLII